MGDIEPEADSVYESNFVLGFKISRMKPRNGRRCYIEIQATKAGRVAIDPIAFVHMAENLTTEEDRKAAAMLKSESSLEPGHKMVDCEKCRVTWDKFYYKQCPGCDGTVPPSGEGS